MERIIVFIIVLLVSQSFLFLEEETLIILSSVLWLDAAGSVIKNVLREELENKGEVVREKYMGYLKMKKEIVEMLIEKNRKRMEIVGEIEKGVEYYIEVVISKLIGNYVTERGIGGNYEKKVKIELVGLSSVNGIKVRELLKVIGEGEK